MKNITPETQYKKYIVEVNRQLDVAKRQVLRIPELEKTSQMTFDEWMSKNLNNLKTYKRETNGSSKI
jgi:hypothetical protein